MAKNFLTDINLKGNQLIQSSFERLATANEPASNLFEGRMYFNTDLEIVRVYDGARWIDSGIPVVSADPADGNYEGRVAYNTTANALKYYDGSAWISVGAGSITSVVGTAGEVDVSSASGIVTISLPTNISANASSADKLSTARIIALSGDVSGSASFDGSASVSINATIQPNSVTLGTDTTGDYVASVGGTDGVSVSGTGEGAAVTIANTDKGSSQNIFKNISDGTTSVVADSNNDTVTLSGGTGISVSANAGTDTLTFTNTGVTSLSASASQFSLSASTGAVTLSFPNTVTIPQDLVVTGDLTVNGTTTTINTQNMNVEDNIITLNYGVTGTPTLNGGLEIERGDLANVQFRWNETLDIWEATTDGTNYYKVLLSGQTASGDISDFTEAAQDAVGTALTDSATVDFGYNDGSNTISASVILATSNSYLSSSAGLAVNKTALESAFITDGFAKKVAGDLANGSNLTSVPFTHNLGTLDVQVQVYDKSTFDTVEVDVIRTDTNTVTLGFSVAPASNAYRVVVVG